MELGVEGVVMRNVFLVSAREISLLEELDFYVHGGRELHFGCVVDGTVELVATGPAVAIGGLARSIISHHTAAH